MGEPTQRYLIPANGPEVEPIKLGLALLAKLVQDRQHPTQAILLIPTKRNIQGTTLEEALGSALAKALLKGDRVSLPGGGDLRLETEQTLRSVFNVHIIMAVYLNKTMLDKIDAGRNVEAVIAVPWIMDKAVEDWRRAWNPRIVGQAPTAPERLIDNPLVEEALRMLTEMVNLGTGLSHPSDREAAIQLFRELKTHRLSFDATSIRSWALRNGWTPKGADQLSEVTQGVSEGKRFRTSRHPPLRSEIIPYLRERIQNRQS